MPIPVMTVAQMRAWEKTTWAKDQTEAEVIRRVGKRVARCARQMTHPGDSILILAGKGHNGEDALAAKDHLKGRKVKVMEMLLPASDLTRLEMMLGDGPDLIVDGLFGIGLNRALGEAWRGIIDRINASGLPVLAVDVPSGLNADTGKPEGAAIRAAVTLAVGAPKSGLLSAQARPFVGRLELAADVGLAECAEAGEWWWTMEQDFMNFPPAREVDGHKGTHGHALLVAGGAGYHGAAVLAARGALRAQPGLVTLLTPGEVYPQVASQLSAAMVRSWQPGEPWPDSVSAVGVGPGLAPLSQSGLSHSGQSAPAAAWSEWLAQLWRDCPVPLVVDASALDGLEKVAGVNLPADRVRVITPHPGEAARLLGTSAAAVQADRPAALRALSRKLGGCWVILKGHATLTGRAAGPGHVNGSGNPFLAQGGAGDVLTGYLTGWLAQPLAHKQGVARLLTHAVWRHGHTADILQSKRSGWTVEDLADTLGMD